MTHECTSNRSFFRFDFRPFVSSVLALFLTSLVGQSTIATELDVKTPVGDLHGPLEFLQHTLVLSAEDGRLIAVADRQLQLGDKGQAFAALQAVFERPHDSFTPTFPGKGPSSAYLSALKVLQQADFGVRRDWAAEMEPLAAIALQSAGSDSAQMTRVARHFPYTPSGIKAASIRAMLALSRGQIRVAKAVLADLESQYANTTVSFNTSALLDALRTNVSNESPAVAKPRLAGGPTVEAPQRLTLPWPKAAWKWQESVWEFPQGVSAFSALTDPTHRAVLSINSWRPSLTRDFMILRTPFRIVAFDRKTGDIGWTVMTDTVGRRDGVKDAMPNQNYGRAPTAEELLKLETPGSVVASERFVFFVDRFRKLNSEVRFPQSFDNQHLPLTDGEQNGGTRLVAIQLQPQPAVAWTLGDAEAFDYRVSADTTVEASVPESSPIDGFGKLENETSSPFDGQYFLGVPLEHDQLLFILSADSESVWLNCLTEATGRLLWQVPISYLDQQQATGRGRLIIQPEHLPGASLCGVAKDTIVCALKTGVAVGVNLTDGRFQWATNVRGDDLSLSVGGQAAFMLRQPAIQRQSFQPFLHQRRMYWSAQQSSHVSCIDTTNGKIIWQVPRGIVSGGVMEGSHDQYAAGVTDDQLILVGDRHIRSINVADGTKVWATYLPPQSGRATCNDQFCLVPLQNGTMAYVNLPNGTLNVVSQETLSDQSGETMGTLLADEEFVYSTTPISVAAYPSGRLRSAVTEDYSAKFIEAQAAILSANIPQAVTILQQEIVKSESPEGLNLAQDLLAKILLRTLALDEFPQPGVQNVSANTSLRPVEILQQLPLTKEQRIRLSVLSGEILNLPDADAAPQMLDLQMDWQARSDVSAWSNLSSGSASMISRFRSSSDSLLAAAEHAILFPSHVGAIDSQLAFADQLVSRRFPAAAELFLLAARRNATDVDRREIDAHVNLLRKPFMKIGSDEVTSPVTFGVFHVEETPHLYADNRIAELLNERVVQIQTPEWFADRLLFNNRLLSVADLNTGVITADVRLPATPENMDGESGFDSPGLLPIVGQDYVGMVSLVTTRKPQLIWWKRFEREEFDLTPMQLGPYGPEFVVVASENRLSCLHPLTGNVLWTRSLAFGSRGRNLFNRAIQFAGDDQVVAVFGEHMQSCEVFRTKDGLRLGVVSLNIPKNAVPIIAGRRVLFPDQQQLRLIDLRDGTDLLQGSGVPKVLLSANAPLISNNRVVMMSEDREIVVLNMATGRIELKCPISAELEEQKQQMSGISAFERNGRIYVLAKNWGNHYSQRSASSRMGEVRVDHGMLFCIDAETGQRLWNQKTLPAVVPQIHGDPIDVLVKWSWNDPGTTGFNGIGFEPRGRAEAAQHRSLTLSVIDAKTGDVKFEADHLSPGEPVRCVHDSKEGTITLESETAEIKVYYNHSAE